MGVEFDRPREFRAVMDRVFTLMSEDPEMGPKLRDADVPQRFEFEDLDLIVNIRAARDGDTAGPSAEGGCEELRELRPNRRSNSAIRASCVEIRAESSSITRACDSTSARSSSRDGCSTPDTTHHQHVSSSRSRSDTPQDRRPET